MGRKPTGFARQKIISRHNEWLDFDEWIMKKYMADKRYSDAKIHNINYALEQEAQKERHKAFMENAKKHGIDISKKKKNNN